MQERMNFGRRLLEIFTQIALVPVAAMTTGLAFFVLGIVTAGVAWFGYYLEYGILAWLKNYTPEEGTTYHVDPSYRVDEDAYGNIEVKYDNGERYTASGSEIAVGFIAFFALPLRLLSLFLSVIALFFPFFNIKAKNNKGTWASIILDII